MNSKICKGCGWVYSTNDPATYCKICGTLFTEGRCYRCKQYKYDLQNGKCYTCRHTLVGKLKKPSRNGGLIYYRKESRKVEEEYRAWQEQIASLPQPYKTLTEDQWLQACKEFRGCALCDNESIDARGFFVPFKDGGRYCAWNVIPVCDTCATEMKRQSNPFRQMHEGINKNLARRRGLGRHKVAAVKEYLQARMDEAKHG